MVGDLITAGSFQTVGDSPFAMTSSVVVYQMIASITQKNFEQEDKMRSTHTQ